MKLSRCRYLQLCTFEITHNISYAYIERCEIFMIVIFGDFPYLKAPNVRYFPMSFFQSNIRVNARICRWFNNLIRYCKHSQANTQHGTSNMVRASMLLINNIYVTSIKRAIKLPISDGGTRINQFFLDDKASVMSHYLSQLPYIQWQTKQKSTQSFGNITPLHLSGHSPPKNAQNHPTPHTPNPNPNISIIFTT